MIKIITNGSKDFHKEVLFKLFDLSISMQYKHVDLGDSGYSKKKSSKKKQTKIIYYKTYIKVLYI
jgi:hypothetical protein